MHVVAALEPVHSLYLGVVEDLVESPAPYQHLAQPAELAGEQQLAKQQYL